METAYLAAFCAVMSLGSIVEYPPVIYAVVGRSVGNAVGSKMGKDAAMTRRAITIRRDRLYMIMVIVTGKLGI